VGSGDERHGDAWDDAHGFVQVSQPFLVKFESSGEPKQITAYFLSYSPTPPTDTTAVSRNQQLTWRALLEAECFAKRLNVAWTYGPRS
jgi:hypothetical protein